jgi:hypothetical protein
MDFKLNELEKKMWKEQRVIERENLRAKYLAIYGSFVEKLFVKNVEAAGLGDLCVIPVVNSQPIQAAIDAMSNQWDSLETPDIERELTTIKNQITGF